MEEVICPEQLEPDFLIEFSKKIDQFEKAFKLHIAVRGEKIMVSGRQAQIRKFSGYLEQLCLLRRKKGRLGPDDLEISLDAVLSGRLPELLQPEDQYSLKLNGREISAKTLNQRQLLQSMFADPMVFAIGPAGTGKTFLAIAAALHSLQTRKVERIVLTRPVVEAGEKLGFLPGDIAQKVNPYFRPLYDALYYLVGYEKTSEWIENGVIEIAPLAYMRGRTINKAFVILDEGQNTLASQMKMFLTRLGHNSRMVITADTTQIDLEEKQQSGIFQALKILRGIDGISFVRLGRGDIVRHPLVQKIVEAYEKKSMAGKNEN